MGRAGEAGGIGGEKFEGIKVICYDSAGWVRKNFQAKVDKHNEVSLRGGYTSYEYIAQSHRHECAGAMVDFGRLRLGL